MRVACSLLFSYHACAFGVLDSPCTIPQIDSRGLDAYGQFEGVLADGSGTIPVDLYRKDDQTTYAVKKYPRTVESSREYTSDIYNEFCIGRSLSHPNIASTIDLVRTHDSWNLVVEYCDRALADVMHASPNGLPVHESDGILLQLLDSMSYMHGEGIAHHDLKPSNIMFDGMGNVKVIDFGTAYRFVDPIKGTVIKRHGPFGSIPFNAPEVYGERQYAAQSVDIYALGVLYCAMLQPRLPWKVDWAPSEWHDDIFGLFEVDDFYYAQDLDVRAWVDPLLSNTEINDDAIRHSVAKLVELLPSHAQDIVSRMLDPNPDARATWKEILASPLARGDRSRLGDQ